MPSPPPLLLLFLSLLVSITVCQNPVFKKFEYKHSFRSPNLAQRDGSIPFWMIDVSVKVTGQGRVGADGLALWYTAQMGTLGPVFGANDFWTGMGLFLDSFDNDNQKNNPQVALMMNDGTRSYDHHTDGSQQILSSCQRDFRNKPFPVRIRIEYMKNVLTVHIDDGMQQQPRYELCMRAENIFLPRNGYFGVSAATGGLADDHDVLDFSAYTLFADAQRPATETLLPQAEKDKYDAEFERQMKEYEAERAKFKEQHPDKAKDDDEFEDAKYFEDQTARELRLIYESQNAIHQTMMQMDERLKQIQASQTGAVYQPPAGGQAPVAAGGGFAPHEKNEVMQNLRDLSSSIRDMKQYVNEIFTKTYNLEQRWGQGAPQVGNAGGGVAIDSSMHQKVDSLINEVRAVRATQSGGGSAGVAGGCPNCLSSSIFLTIIFLQSAVIIVIVYWRSKPEKAKFY
ncbi:hypothetical protein WR25_17668 [Diploscapter pachys]|uniref:L-type lectin-like domain-containing protein n=1 Tax=Diploscapter pachys TaxID=2018661 RepID=A0A2A2KWM1_9BILA|nr:hypothetical protein WR25_17668 [Diploscapter pachys]